MFAVPFNPKLAAKIAVAAVLALAMLGTGLYIRHLKSNIATLTEEKAEIQAKYDLQMLAVKQLREDAEQRAKAAEKKIKEAEEKASKNEKKAQIIYKTKPSVPGNDCQSALNLINGD